MYSLSFMPTSLTQMLSLRNGKLASMGIPADVNQCSNWDMGIFDTRILRLAKLIRDDFGDNQAAFSRHVDIKASQVNRWLSTTAEKRPVINEISARQIEEKCLKSPGWLDSESDQPILSKHAQECAAIINQMTPEEQHDFLF